MLNYEAVLNFNFEPIEQTYSSRDTMLYALGLGASQDPLDRKELHFTFEKDLRVIPTMPVILCRPFPWYKNPALGIDWVRMLHGEQALQVHRPLPPAGSVIGKNRVKEVIDKGRDRGALLYLEREIFAKESGDHLATSVQTLMLRGNGGFGGPAIPTPKLYAIPERQPDVVVDRAIDRRAALIYRLSGDDNPIHADPDLAVKAGFTRPIFHGLGTFGMVAFELLKHVSDYDAHALKSISARFRSPVYPGETLRLSMWIDGTTVSFCSSVPERQVTVVDGGLAIIAHG